MSPRLPPETPGSQIADAEGRVRIFYEAEDAQGNKRVGSTFVIANEQDTLATLELEAEEAAYLGVTEGGDAYEGMQPVRFVNVLIIPALPVI